MGEGIFQNSIYPFYTLIRQISVGDFIENLDSIEVLYFLITLFFKMSIHLFAEARAIQQLTLVPNGRIFVLPVAAIYILIKLTINQITIFKVK